MDESLQFCANLIISLSFNVAFYCPVNGISMLWKLTMLGFDYCLLQLNQNYWYLWITNYFLVRIYLWINSKVYAILNSIRCVWSIYISSRTSNILHCTCYSLWFRCNTLHTFFAKIIQCSQCILLICFSSGYKFLVSYVTFAYIFHENVRTLGLSLGFAIFHISTTVVGVKMSVLCIITSKSI